MCIFCLPYNVDIKPKNTEYDLMNFCDSNWEIKEIFKKILKENFRISYNRNFSLLYKIIAKTNKKDYIHSLEALGFKKMTGISLHYVIFIIKLTKNENRKNIKKIWYIKIKIYIRRFLLSILWTLNEKYIEKIILNLETIKIKINFFEIKVNGNTGSKSIMTNIRNAGVLDTKIIGQYKDLQRNTPPHVVVRVERHDRETEKKESIMAALTTKSSVTVWKEDGSKEKIKTLECGKTNSGEKQYALPIKAGENFEKRYELKENLGKDIIRNFNIGKKEDFLGKIIEVGANLKNCNIKEGVLRDSISKKIEMEMKSENSINKEDIKILNSTQHNKIGEEAYKNLTIEEKFILQKEFYNKVEKTKKDEDYYDI